ncbi:hypothetical protein OHB24_35600 [Kribbella sp. NBC_00482]|uniref:hypothetical protein n=1 Tax=Kribbella sp. NBC_00482 TaxID=2975968 RepID=UPI002E185CE1
MEDDNNDEWTNVDLFAAFPASSAVAISDKEWAERILGALAAISAFLPVAWTWWSFHAATEAYQAVVARGKENGRTFLSLWTTGFDGGLASVHRLIPTAQISVGLILFAIGCVVVHRFVAHAAADREDNRRHEAQSELTACIALARRLLDQRRADDPVRLEAMIKRSVDALRQANETTLAGSTELRESVTELRTSLADLIASAIKATTGAKASADVARTANADLQLAMDRTLKELSTAVQTHVTDLHDGTKIALEKAGRSASSAGSAISAEVAKVAKSQQNLATGVATLSVASGGIKTELNSIITELGKSLETINGSLSQHESAMQAQTTELSRSYDAAERMLRTIERLGGPETMAG